MSHSTEGDGIAMAPEDNYDEQPPFPFAYEDDGVEDEHYDMFDEAHYQKERDEDREYAIRQQALGAAMQLNAGKAERHSVNLVIEDAEEFAKFLRGKAA